VAQGGEDERRIVVSNKSQSSGIGGERFRIGAIAGGGNYAIDVKRGASAIERADQVVPCIRRNAGHINFLRGLSVGIIEGEDPGRAVSTEPEPFVRGRAVDVVACLADNANEP